MNVVMAIKNDSAATGSFGIGSDAFLPSWVFVLTRNEGVEWYVDSSMLSDELGVGNKRVALAATLVFLDFHGIEVYDRADALFELVMGIARSQLSKDETTTRLAELCTVPW